MNAILAVVCILSLVLAGAFVQALVPGSGVGVTIEKRGFCPPGAKGPFCGGDAGAGSDEEEGTPESTDSAPSTPATGTPTPTAGTTSTPAGTDQPRDGTPTASPQPTTIGATPSATPAAPTTEAPTTAPTSPDRAAPPTSGLPFEWLVWLALLPLGGLVLLGALTAYRRGTIESPRDLLAIPVIAIDVVVSALLRVVLPVASGLRSASLAAGRAVTIALSSARVTLDPTDTSDTPGLAARLLALLSWVLGWLAASLGLARGDESDPEPSSADSTSPAPEETDEPAGDPHESTGAEAADIRAAWRWLASRVGVDSTEPRTPDEIARAAIAAGYPPESVNQLLRAFRDVTYGDYPAAGERRQAARAALERLRKGPHTGSPSGGEEP